MKLLTTAAEWELFQEDESTGEMVELQVRPVPAPLLRDMEIRHLGRKRSYHQKKGVQIVEVDVDKGEALADEKAAYSLMDSRGRFRTDDPASPRKPSGFEVEVGESGEFYSKELGQPITGDSVRLDGHWTPAIKAHLFRHYPSLVVWVNERAAAKTKKGKEEEADLGKT